MKQFLEQLANICRMIKIEHSIFAMPYAWAGAFLAAGGLPPIKILLWLTLAMVGVRSFAMTFNRIADVGYDKLNPRTRTRPLVTGVISMRYAWLFCLFSAIVFIGSCYFLNNICFVLSIPALIFAAVYSLLKRVSPLCHYWLGATLGLAPMAGWLAVHPDTLGLSVILLFLAVTFWVGAFDIYYAFQDIKFDAQYKLHSIPSDFGENTAMTLAGFSHIITVIFLILAGLAASLGWPWYAIVLGISILLVIEHHLVRPDDLKHVNTAFFTINGIISPLVLAGVILGLYCQ